MPAARCPHFTARQVDFGNLQLRLGFMQLTAGDGRIDLGVFPQFGTDRLWPQGGTPGRFTLAQAQLLGAGLGHRAGLVEGRLEAFAVDAHQQVAGLDLLVVTGLQLAHPAGHIRGDHHHIGAHTGIAGPGGEHVVLPQLIAGEHGKGHHTQGDQGTYGRTHRNTPL
ncbi:hypothetical protein D3C75_888150 [compost metagenome]